MRAAPKLSPIDRQRQEAAWRIIRYGDGFGWHRKRCYACPSNLTAKVRGKWTCPSHLEVKQLILVP